MPAAQQRQQQQDQQEEQQEQSIKMGFRTTRTRPVAIFVLLGLLQLLSLLVQPTTAAFITFQNCLDPNIINSNPLELQFIPLYVNAHFNSSDQAHNLNVTIYGNVSGQAVTGTYPPATDPGWTNSNDTCKQQ